MKEFLAKLLRRPAPTKDRAPEHCVRVIFRLGSGHFGDAAEREAIHRFTDQLAEAIAVANTGEFDGDEFGEGGCTLFMYGPNADRLYSSVQPLLEAWPPVKGGWVVKRHGPPGANEQRIPL